MVVTIFWEEKVKDEFDLHKNVIYRIIMSM